MSDCLTDEQIAAIVDGTATSESDAAAQAHIDVCVSCRRLVAAVGRAASSAGLGDTAGAAPPALDTSRLTRGTSVGRYVITDLVGAGAMGVVYAAYDPELDRKVALKFLHGHTADDPASRARLLREAKAMAKLSDPAVVPVHDAGVFQGGVFVAMEFIEGETLAAWLRSSVRSWREVLRAFMDAGRGLAAAHGAGIVHRDFKPENVLVGRDGRVRVSDFGLARTEAPTAEPGHAGDGAQASERSRPEGPAVDLTRTGALVGTPAYMAPEQLERRPATPATDQFSFCVALFEGLHGRRPFAGASFIELRDAVRAGRVTAAPADSQVPGWLRRVVLRGLSARPEDRHASMTALLDGLARDPSIQRRRALLVAGAVVVLVLGGVELQRSATRNAPVCQGADAEIAEVWGPAGKQAVHAALIASGAPETVAAPWATFERLVDDYARRWAAQRTEACEATRVRGTQSDELLDLRMACLHDELESLRALVGVFSQPRPKLVDGAVKAASSLPPLARCQEEAALRVRVPPPSDDQRARVDALHGDLARANALHFAGDYAESARVATTVVRAARTLGYLPVEAEALELQARSEVSQRRLKEGAADYQDALYAALAAGHERVAAAALVALTFAIGVQLGRNDEGQRLSERASALAERLGEQRLIADALYFGGIVRFESGDIEGAEKSFVRAKTIRTTLFGAVHPDVANAEGALGRVANARGDFRAADRHYEESVSILERALGRDHPLLDAPVANLAETDWEDLADYPAALRRFDRTLALRRRRGLRNADVGFALCERGGVLADLGQVAEGVAAMQEGLAMSEAEVGGAHLHVAKCQRVLARVLTEEGRLDEALALAGSSHATFVKTAEAQGAVESGYILAEALSAAGKRDAAIAAAREAADAAARDLHAEHPYTARAHGALCRVLVEQGRPDALAACQAAAAELVRALGLTHPLTAEALTCLGEAWLARGEPGAAVTPLVEAHTVLATRTGDAQLRSRARAALDRAVRAEAAAARASR
jgi:tetratricopeptide (TPR) repeat protein